MADVTKVLPTLNAMHYDLWKAVSGCSEIQDVMTSKLSLSDSFMAQTQE